MIDRSPARVVIVLAAVLIGGGLYGWNGDDRTAGTGSRAPDAGHGIAMAPRFAPRPYIGKPRPPVSVTLAEDADLEVGVPTELRIEVRTALPVTNLELLAEGDGGLALIDVERLGPVSAVRGRDADLLQGDLVARYSVGVVPVGPGEGSVSGQVKYMIRGVEQAAPFRISVLPGGGKYTLPSSARPDTAVVTDAGGERLAVLPAETDVREGLAR